MLRLKLQGGGQDVKVKQKMKQKYQNKKEVV
jgi:hypothetical protein